MNLIKIIPALFSGHYDHMTVKEFKEEFEIGTSPLAVAVVNDGQFDKAYELALNHQKQIGIPQGKVILISGLSMNNALMNHPDVELVEQMKDPRVMAKEFKITKIEPAYEPTIIRSEL